MQYKRAENGGHNALKFYKFPPMAIASILHRLSGLLLFVLIPFLLGAFALSLHSPQGFASVASCFNSWVAKLITWAFLSALIYHFLAGIRHLLMDMGFGESLHAGRRSSYLVMIVSLLLIIWLGVRIL